MRGYADLGKGEKEYRFCSRIQNIKEGARIDADLGITKGDTDIVTEYRI